MELRHLRYFITVGELLSFTQAAAKLHVAQPALSRQIRSLEDELGVKLLERNSRAVCLTAAGKTFLPEARAVLKRAEEAIATVRQSALHEVIRIGYAPSLAAPHLPAALERWNTAHPQMRAELHDMSSAEMLAGLQQGRLEVAIGPKPVKTPAGLATRQLHKETWLLAIPPRHALAPSKRVAAASLKGVPMLAFTAADYPEYAPAVAAYLRPLGIEFAPVQECDGVMSLISAVESGAGVAFVSSGLGFLFPSRVPLRKIDPAPPAFPVAVIWRPASASAASQAFVDSLVPVAG